jgi:hypothetical protein
MSLDLTTHTAWVRARLCKLQKRCIRLAAQVIKFTSCFPWSVVLSAYSPTNIGRYDIAEILLKVALKHNKSEIKLNDGNPCFAYL